VDNSLGRFSLRKRKEFVTEACKYWTLKREARKGAALLKRLQLSLESFSPMEITRRNFSGMGAAGRPRLLRRIEFGDILQEDVNRLETLVSGIRQREELSLIDTTEVLRSLIDNVYFPIIPLLRPILQRAQKYVQRLSLP
jgi:NuA3 HAT complex component NTO1